MPSFLYAQVHFSEFFRRFFTAVEEPVIDQIEISSGCHVAAIWIMVGFNASGECFIEFLFDDIGKTTVNQKGYDFLMLLHMPNKINNEFPFRCCSEIDRSSS